MLKQLTAPLEFVTSRSTNEPSTLGRAAADHPAAAAHHHAVVETAEAFVRAHLSDQIQIAHLCRLTGVSERTLRNAFYAIHGLSPKQFLLRARLDEVRSALMRRHTATVTTIATDCGFYELGRFAGQYKALFGEYPSDTLRARGDAAWRPR